MNDNTIDIQEAKKIKLFNRVERKYVCTKNQLYHLLGLIKEKYYMVTDEEDFLFQYHSIYFDTPDLSSFNAHEFGLTHRQKIRIREYSTGEKFLEIKDKAEDGRSRKCRIPVNSYTLDGEMQWIDKNFIYDTANLEKKLDVKYNRITFISFDKSERITIDLDIIFYNYTNDIEKEIPDVIIEIKQSQTHKSFIEDELLKFNLSPTKFSKYYQGIKMTKDDN